MRAPLAPHLLAVASLVLITCGPPHPVHRAGDGAPAAAIVDSGTSDTGGAPETGGSGGTASGGSTGTGGSVGTGGSLGTGGSMGTGGNVGTGGSTGTGGSMGTGGRAGTGGSGGTGGSPGTGGSGTGGVGGTGGSGGGCSALQAWRQGTYKAGDEVKNGSPPHRYRCKEYPFEGWCGITAYEPPSGRVWMDAWNDLGACP